LIVYVKRKTRLQIKGYIFSVTFDFHGDNGGSNPPGDAKLTF
jgi:hypothetical protein